MPEQNSVASDTRAAAYDAAFLDSYRKPWLRKLAERPVTWVVLVEFILVVVFGLLSINHAFWSSASVSNLALSSSQILLLCVTQAMLLSAGQLDLSQGALVIFTSVITGKVMIVVGSGGGIPLGILAGLATGALLGAINGLLVAKVGINSLVATLGMLSVATGSAQVLTNGTNLIGLPPNLQSNFGIQKWLGLPAPILVSLVLIAITWAVYRQTGFGAHTLAIGSNQRAARRAGVTVDRHLIMLYVLSGLAAAVAGFIDLSRFLTTDISGHTSDALAAISGAVIGGTSLTGGLISFPGAMFGSLLAVILQTGLVVLNLPPFYQTIAIGVVLIGAVTFDRIRARRSPER